MRKSVSFTHSHVTSHVFLSPGMCVCVWMFGKKEMALYSFQGDIYMYTYQTRELVIIIDFVHTRVGECITKYVCTHAENHLYNLYETYIV